LIRIAVLDKNDICQYIVNEFDEDLQSAEDYGGNIVKIEADVELKSILNKRYDGKSFIKNETSVSLSTAELTIMETQAEIYEQQSTDNLTMMETMAEIYETLLGGE